MVDEEIGLLLELVVCSLILGFWLINYNQSPVENTAFVRDLCYLVNSPNGTAIKGEYSLDLYLQNNTLVSNLPISSMCFSRMNETTLIVPVVTGKAIRIKGKVQLSLSKINNSIIILEP